jgi:DNA polymerase elongation subunit (family B)
MNIVAVHGWILDVYIEGIKAVLWIRTEKGEVFRLTERYKPIFYIKPKHPYQIQPLTHLLCTHPNITHAEHKKKYISLDMDKSDVICVNVDSVLHYKKVLNDIKSIKELEEYYNVDLLHVQQYLYQKGIYTTCKARIIHTIDCELQSIEIVEDNLENSPPPFTTLIFSIGVKSSSLSPDQTVDPIAEIVVYDENLDQTESFKGEEKDILQLFQEYIKIINPDFLVAIDVEETLTYILERARILDLNLQLGREEVDIFRLRKLLPYSHKGRVHIDIHEYQTMGIAGIVERCRFTYAPPGLSAKWQAGRIIDSRQCYEAVKKDILIPRARGFYQFVRTVEDTIFSDRGGLIISPQVKLHENVATLDFESMYPSIIKKHNVSYETVTPNKIRNDEKGFLPILAEQCLKRRLHFKHLRKTYSKNSQERLWCEQRQTALKGILVVIYGYSGCFANRFSNVTCYEEINRLARETLIQAMNISLNEGFEVIYADSDSLFVSKKGACKDDFVVLAKKISDETGLPMALEHHFKFLVLLTQESHPNLEATRRYFGKLSDGELYYRGIELRRHDSPKFLKQFEEKLIKILLDAESAEQIWQIQYIKALNYVVETCDLINSGKVNICDLVISKSLRKYVYSYHSLFPHVVAAIQMSQKGKKLHRGEMINFIYINAKNKNPFRRVVSTDISKNYPKYYDREKYMELVLDTAETVLSIFGFNRKKLNIRAIPKDFLKKIVYKKHIIVPDLKLFL